MLKAIKTGDWAKAAEYLNTSAQLKKAIHYAVEKEAHDARRLMIKGITEQAPGGKAFTPLKAITLAIRRARGFRGSKALIVTGTLRNSITVKRVGTGQVWVGVLRTSRGPDGRQLYNIAKIQEEGATLTVRQTPKMHAYLMVMLRKAGYKQFKRTGKERFDKRNWKVTGYTKQTRTVVIRIPPRPFIRPVIEKMFSNPIEVRNRMAKRVAIRMKLMLGDGK